MLHQWWNAYSIVSHFFHVNLWFIWHHYIRSYNQVFVLCYCLISYCYTWVKTLFVFVTSTGNLQCGFQQQHHERFSGSVRGTKVFFKEYLLMIAKTQYCNPCPPAFPTSLTVSFPLHSLSYLLSFSVFGHCAVKDLRHQDLSMMWCASAWQVLEKPACFHASVVKAATASFPQQVSAEEDEYTSILVKKLNTQTNVLFPHKISKNVCFKNMLSFRLESQITVNTVQVSQLSNSGKNVFSLHSKVSFFCARMDIRMSLPSTQFLSSS